MLHLGELHTGVLKERGEHKQSLAAWRAAAHQTPGEDIFPAGRIPDPTPAGAGPEAFVPPDQDDPVGQRCCPGDAAGMWYYNVSVPQLYSYPVDPTSANFKDAALVVFPGGGHEFLAWNKEGTDIAQWLNSLGYSAFVLKYRIPEAVMGPRSLQDAQRALSLVRSRSAQLGISASRIGVIGFSAGGGLCANVAHQVKRAYEPIDDVDTFNFRPDFSMPIYGMGLPQWAATTAPTFLASSQNDQCVPVQAVTMYYQALSQHHVRAELHLYGDGHHGYGRCSMWTHSGEWDDVCKWPEDAAYYLEDSVMGNKRQLPPGQQPPY